MDNPDSAALAFTRRWVRHTLMTLPWQVVIATLSSLAAKQLDYSDTRAGLIGCAVVVCNSIVMTLVASNEHRRGVRDADTDTKE